VHVTTVSNDDLLIKTADEITDVWLQAVLGREDLRVVTVERVGTGQMSLTLRITYSDGTDAQATVIAKIAAEDEKSRGTGIGMGAYQREVTFYQLLRDRIGGPLPEHHAAVYDSSEGWFTLVMEDAVGAEQGDQIAGCDVETADVAMRALARVHAPVWNDLSVGLSELFATDAPNPLGTALLEALIPGFFERYDARISEEHKEVIRRYAAAADAHNADRPGPFGLTHSDFRLDNVMFGGARECIIVDWQSARWGKSVSDVAYFIGGALATEDRRAHERDLVRVYYDTLLANGVTDFTWEQCWDEYRRYVFWGISMVIVPSMFVEQTERGDDMFMSWLERSCQQAIDLGSLDLLPTEVGAPVPLRPVSKDESPHPAGEEPLWSESWYLDAISEDGSLGLYSRIGDTANRDCAHYMMAIVRPGRAPIVLNDLDAPHPSRHFAKQSIQADDFSVLQTIKRPMVEIHSTFSGTAREYASETSMFHGDEGTPIEVAFDLTWRTTAIPYQWRITTRYEVACSVEGTVTIDGEQIAFTGVGQRDHSWGLRDWWAQDWMWSALHLEDGTRIHAAIIDERQLAFGYVQSGGVVNELASGRCRVERTDPDLVDRCLIHLDGVDMDLEVTPTAHGSVLLLSDDGRECHFLRSLVAVRTADGRTGCGWIEWGFNPRAAAQ
jgi:hypothetical protein